MSRELDREAPIPKKKDTNPLSAILNWLSCIISPLNKKPPKPQAPSQNSQLTFHSKHTLLTSAASSSTTTITTDLELVFRYFDKNGDGKISATELQSCLRSMGEEITLEEAVALLEAIDTDGDGLLGFDDFVKLVDSEEEEEERKNLREAFSVYEMEGEGCITAKSLSRALARLGESKSVEECKFMIRRFDINGDGVISFDEFRIMML